ERLFQRSGPDKLRPLTLFKAAVAFQRAGDKANLEKAWKHIEAKAGEGGLALGNGKAVPVPDLRGWVARLKSNESTRVLAGTWPLPYGDPTHTAQGVGGTGFLKPKSKNETVGENTTKTFIDKALEQIDQVKQPVLPGFWPVAAIVNGEGGKTPMMIYRTWFGIEARNVKTGEVEWNAPSAWSVDRMLREPKHTGAIQQWLQTYVGGPAGRGVRPGVLFENSVTGSAPTA